MHRRQLLARAGAAAAAAAMAGCARDSDRRPTATDTTTATTREPSTTIAERTDTVQTTADRRERYADRFASVVDFGEFDVAADASESILPFLEEHVTDDTLVFFPEGRYLLPDAWEVPGFTNLGFVGDGATIVPRDGFSGYLFTMGTPGHARDLLFDGLTFDFTAPDTGARPIQALVDDGLEVRNVAVRGVQDTGQDMMRFDVTAPHGTGLVEGMRLPDGGVPETPTTGCFVGPTSTGSITFRDCHVAGFPDNGLYASAAQGPVRVVGGTYENNGIANVRVGGDSLVRDVHVRCDEARQGIENMRGIRLRQGANARVENCVVELREVTYSDGAITIAPWLESAVVRDTRIVVDADEVPGIRLKTPIRPDRVNPHVECRNVHVDGTASGNAAVQVVDRDACVFENLCIRQTGADRDGVYLLRSRDSVVRDAAIAVTGDPLVLEDSTAETFNVRTAGANSGGAALDDGCGSE